MITLTRSAALRVLLIAAVTATVTLLAKKGLSEMETPPVEYLSEILSERVVFSAQDWGVLGINTCTHAEGKKPLPLRIKDRVYENGLGHHASGEIVVELNGEFKTFEAEIGIQWQGRNLGSVVFQVFVDDEKRFDSGVVTEEDDARPIRVSVAGAEELRLVVTDAGDGITCDCANWVNARLIRDPSASPRPAEPPLDVAPFARVVTSDPNRKEGARAGRLDEFHPDDVFLDSEVVQANDGTYTAPVWNDGLGSIGLLWAERRVLTEVSIEFADPQKTPSPEEAQLQYWSSEGRKDSWGGIGQTWWQGRWERLQADIEVDGSRFVVRFPKKTPEFSDHSGIHKIRWVFPCRDGRIVVRKLSAFTRSRWAVGEFRIDITKPDPGGRAIIEIYNGVIVNDDETHSLRREWNLSEPIQLKIRYCRPRRKKNDRTIVRLSLPTGAFGIAIEDVLKNECVYVHAFGVLMARASAVSDMREYPRRIVERTTILERVRKMPDQTFARAKQKLHDPIQDRDPMMLSLACDNNKFIVFRNGGIEFAATNREATAFIRLPYEIRPRFGSGKNEGLTRRLDGRWLPAPVIAVKENGIIYRQRVFVTPYDKDTAPDSPGWLNPKPLCVVELTAENRQKRASEAAFSVTFVQRPQGGAQNDASTHPKRVEPGFTIAKADGGLLAFMDVSESGSLHAAVHNSTIQLDGRLPAGGIARCFIYVPAWHIIPEEYRSLQGGEKLISDVKAYWEGLLSTAMQLDFPEPELMDIIRASQVHILMAARNVEQGREIAAWVGADRYGPLDTEAHAPILGMDMFGHHDFARRSLDYFIHRYNDKGYLARGYTIVGAGQHLWTLGRHFSLTRDAQWLKGASPKVKRVCQWIVKQREKTRRLAPRGERLPEYGLVPPGVLADWNRYAYYFYMNGYFYAGLKAAARALKETGAAGADELLEEAKVFRKDILRAYHWNQARMPVVPLRDGTWAPACPSSLYCFGKTSDFYGGVSAIGHDVEVGGGHLINHGVIEPDGQDAEWIVDYMEDVWFFIRGITNYSEEAMERDWFDMGGFSKLQPYYTRIADIHAARDDVKPFIRAYFNSVWPFVSTETLALWEHFLNRGGWNKTHETGWFLEQTRLMFVMERGDELWLAPFVTNNWMKDGMTVSVRNAPTEFGPVSYTMGSAVGRGYIEAKINPPARSTPTALVIRLRHPEGKQMRAVTVNGKPHRQFDPQGEFIRITALSDVIEVRADY